MTITYKEERLSAEEYIDFLKRTDLGSQYPKERFRKRIEKLVQNASISLTARNEEGKIVGVLFGLTDFCYWLYVTDLGVDRDYEGRGIGTKLMRARMNWPAAKRTLPSISSQMKKPCLSIKSWA